MKLYLKSATSVFALAILLLTSISSAMEEEQKDDSAHRAASLFPCSFENIGAGMPSLSLCCEGAMVSSADPLGIAGPTVQENILREAQLTIQERAHSPLPLPFCDAVHEQATRAASALFGSLIKSSSICAIDDPLLQHIFQLPQALRDMIADHVRDPHNENSVEAECSIVMAGFIRSLVPILGYTGAIKKLLQSSRKRLQYQNGQLDHRTMNGSLSIRRNNTWIEKSHLFDRFLKNPKKVFFNFLLAMSSKYFQISNLNLMSIHMYIPGHPVTHKMFQTFCRERGMSAKTTAEQCTKLLELFQKFPNHRRFDPYKNTRIHDEDTDDGMLTLHIIAPHADYAALKKLWKEREEKEATADFIKRTMNQSIFNMIGQFLRNHLFQDVSYFMNVQADSDALLRDD